LPSNAGSTWGLDLTVDQAPNDGDVITVYTYGDGELSRRFKATPGHAAPQNIEVLGESQLKVLRDELLQARVEGAVTPVAVRALLEVVESLIP
jgi:hypothetical protein